MKKFYLFFFISLFALCKKSQAQITVLQENFSTCAANLPVGWQQYSVVGTDSWKCTASGLVGNAVYMNGYSGGGNNANEDWLISPQLNLNSYATPHLSFWSRTKFSGNPIQVMVSNNYNGSGNPNVATWTTLSLTLPATNSDIWFLSENIDLTAYKAQPFYLAFKYTSTVNAAALWRIDEINLLESALNLQKKFVNVGQCSAGYYSSSNQFVFTMSGLNGSLDLTAPNPFQISKDNSTFTSQLSYNAAASGIPQTVYARINPTIANKVYRDSIQFSYNGNPVKGKQYILGTSLPDDHTLRVVNWNMRWFGEPTWCNCDTGLARLNATTILKDLAADVYCIQELVNVNQLNMLTAALGPNYQSVVSQFCSGATNAGSGFYPTCQKLAYIFNTNKVQNLGTFGLLSSTYPADTMPYYCFSSGRFPFMMKAKLLLANAATDTILFANIHGKASTTQADYDRRLCAAEKMTDSLNVLFPNQKIMVIGDYNDYLEGSAVPGNINSPYKYLLDHGFTGISLPSKYPGQSTYFGSTNHIIDNIACRPNLFSKYIDSSFFIFTETGKYITDYSNTTSDHYPCMSYYQFVFPNAITDINFNESNLQFDIKNPSGHELTIFNPNAVLEDMQLTVYDVTGKIKYRNSIHFSMQNASLPLPFLSSGLYFVELRNKSQRGIQKWIVE